MRNGEKDENLGKKSELIGSQNRAQTILEAAVISRGCKRDISQRRSLRLVLRRAKKVSLENSFLY